MSTKPIGSEVFTLGSVDLLQGAADPSAGAGVAAPVGSFYLRTTGEQWSKTGVGDTAWTLVGSGGGGMAIGGTVTGGTARDLLFVGAGPVLAQSNNLSYTTDGVLRFVDVGSPAVPAPDGGLTCSNGVMRISQNGQPFRSIATYDGSGPFDGYVAYGHGYGADGTHIGPPNALSPWPLYWDETQGRLGVGTASPLYSLHVIAPQPGTPCARFQIAHADNYAGLEFVDSVGGLQGAIGWAASAVSVTNLRNLNFLYSTGPDWVIATSTANEHRFGVTHGSASYQFADGAAAAVSDAGTAKLRYNSGSASAEVSLNGGAYSPLATLAKPQTFTASQNVALVTLTDAANIATDAALGNVFKVTLGASRTLDNPTNLVAGGVYRWIIHQEGTGGWNLSYGTAFKWEAATPLTPSAAAGAIDTIEAVYDGASLLCTFAKGFA